MTDKLRVELIDAAGNVMASSETPGQVVNAHPGLSDFRIRRSLIDSDGNIVPGSVTIGEANSMAQIIDQPFGSIITVDIE